MEIKVNTKTDRRNLGFGTYGPIVKGFYKDRKVAVKKVPHSELIDSFSSLENALLQWDSPHLVKLIFAENDSNFRYFAFEQCKNSLDQLINSEKRFRTPRYKILSCRKAGVLRPKELKVVNETLKKPEHHISSFVEPRLFTFEFKEKLLNDFDSYKQYKRSNSSMPMPTDENVLLQLAMGLDYIHKQGIAYGCVKPENVLVDDTWPSATLKWADFGLTKLTIPNSDLPIAIRLSSHTGLWTWMAPELLKKLLSGKQFTSINDLDPTAASDIFSAGCLFFYVVTRGTHPFGDQNEAPMNIAKMEASNFEELPQEHSLRELIENMISESATSRIQLERVIEVLTELADRREREVGFLELCSQSEMEEEEMLPLIRDYIDAGVDLNCTDEQGRTPLMMLYLSHSVKSRFKSTELLLGKKKDMPASPTVKSQAPCAQRRRRVKDTSQQSRERSPSPMKIVHADVNCADNAGRNALMYLVTGKKRENIQETVKLFLWNGVDINHQDESGNNALMYLCSSYKGSDIIELAGTLISYGLDVNHVNIAGDNALYCLLSNVDDERFELIEVFIKLLVRDGIDVNHENKSGQNVLLKLLWDSHPSVEIIKLLIRSGIDLHRQPRQGWDALFYLNKDYAENEVKDVLQAAEKTKNLYA